MDKSKRGDGMRFWARFAGVYERAVRGDAAAYERMYELIRSAVRGKDVLELAAGTGMIARNIADAARRVLATDFSPQMIAEAKRRARGANVEFDVCDARRLPFPDGSFDVVIVANALHVMPRPEEALSEAARVLRPEGLLIAPTFTHAGNGRRARAAAALMGLAGFPLQRKWSAEGYLDFLCKNGFCPVSHEVLPATFPLTYVECFPESLML